MSRVASRSLVNRSREMHTRTVFAIAYEEHKGLRTSVEATVIFRRSKAVRRFPCSRGLGQCTENKQIAYWSACHSLANVFTGHEFLSDLAVRRSMPKVARSRTSYRVYRPEKSRRFCYRARTIRIRNRRFQCHRVTNPNLKTRPEARPPSRAAQRQ